MPDVPSLPPLPEILAALREAKDQGRRVVGILPHAIVPDEIVHAAGAVPVRFCLGGPGEVQSAIYLPETTCGFQQVQLGFFEAGRGLPHEIYDLVDVVIAGTFCTGVQNTATYLERYFDKRQYRLVAPYWNTPNSTAYFAAELRELARFLERTCETRVTPARLNASIALYDDLRTLFQALDAFRQTSPPTVGARDVHALVYHLFLRGPEATAPVLRAHLDAARAGQLPSREGLPVFLTGNGVLYHDPFLSLLENCGFRVVGDDLFTGAEFFSSRVYPAPSSTLPAARDPYRALAERHFQRTLAGRMIPETYRWDHVLAACRRRRARGIINHCLKFCDAYSPNADRFKHRMQAAGFPVLNLERDYSHAGRGQVLTRLEAFAEILEVR